MKTKRSLWGTVLILLLTVVAYIPALRCGFIWDDAISTAQKAIRLANSGGQTQLVSRIAMRLELYQAKRPYYAPQDATGSRVP